MGVSVDLSKNEQHSDTEHQVKVVSDPQTEGEESEVEENEEENEEKGFCCSIL
jgi:hypothetical protein